MLLALHGADVIKVEPPEGDWGRALGEIKGDHCAHSVAFNRGKRSIALDLKSADGIAVVKKIAGARRPAIAAAKDDGISLAARTARGPSRPSATGSPARYCRTASSLFQKSW